MNSVYYLQNSRGERIELVSMIEHPSNMYSIDYNTIRFTNDCDFEINQEELRFKPFDIDLIFKFDSYSSIRTGLNFIDYNDEMILQKTVVQEGITYNRRVVFKKGEEKPVKQVELYNVTVTVTALSEWYTRTIINTVPSSNASIYPYTYPIEYGEGTAGNLDLFNEQHRYISLDLIITGESQNPRWELLDAGDNVIQDGLLNLNIPANRKLVVNTSRSRLYLTDLHNNFIENVYANQDFSKITFLSMNEFGQYRIRVFQDNASPVNARVEYLNTRSVI